MKKVLIDASSIVKCRRTTHLSGIGRSTLLLLEALAEKEKLPFEIQLITQRVRGDGLSDYNFSFKQIRIPLPNEDKYKQLVNKFHIKELFTNYDLLHIPHNTDSVNQVQPFKTVYTIHDLMYYKFPEFFPSTKEYRDWEKMTINKSKGIITCSESSKSDIVNYLGVSAEKVSVVNWGIDRNTFYPANESDIISTKKILGIALPYFLAVSCSHPRKNTELTLRGFREFNKQNNYEYQLILLWSNPPKALLNLYAEEITDGKIIFANHVDDNHLRNLYSGAEATLFPSFYEGFGFPILESFACHTPVITCKNSSLEEIGGDFATYTSETDIDDFVFQMSNITNQKTPEFITNIENHLISFSWSNTANQYVEFYKNMF